MFSKGLDEVNKNKQDRKKSNEIERDEKVCFKVQ